MQTIAITNRKGGVGKTTTALNLAAELTNRGKKVFLIDIDPQGNLSSTIGHEGTPHNSLALLQGELKARQRTPQGDFVAATAELAKADVLFKDTGKEYKLREALVPLQTMYDYCIIDTPPALGILTTQALTAADYVIIPTQPDRYGIQGITQLTQIMAAVKKYCNPNLKIGGILVTRYRHSIVKDSIITQLAEMARQLDTRLFETRIRECNALFEAQMLRTDIFTHEPKSNAASDYRAFTDELLRAIE